MVLAAAWKTHFVNDSAWGFFFSFLPFGSFVSHITALAVFMESPSVLEIRRVAMQLPVAAGLGRE